MILTNIPHRNFGALSAVGVRFARHRGGAIAPMFAVTILVLLLASAIAIELGRWVIAQNQLQVALDAGVLAGASHLQTNPNDSDGAVKAARAVFKLNRDRGLWTSDMDDDIDFEVRGLSVTAIGEAHLTTILSEVMKVKHLPLERQSEATITRSTIELALMLDLTGSMCKIVPNLRDAPCKNDRKIKAMKDAAKDLIDTMLANEGLASRVRISLVPFSNGVRLSREQLLVAAGPTPSVKVYSEQEWHYNYRASKWESWTFNYYYHPTECAAERIGPEKYTDAPPQAGQYVMTAMREGRSRTDSTPVDFGCSPDENSVVVPLTNDKNALLNVIDSLTAKGGTAGHLGTAWAWYTLSPNWNKVWSNSANHAAAYPMEGGKALRKIAVLMTDGEYLQQHSKEGYLSTAKGYSSAANGESKDQALSLCKNMKAKGVEIYTVGFEVGEEAVKVLQDCASSAEQALMADSSESLVKTFKAIGQRVLSLHLTQ